MRRAARLAVLVAAAALGLFLCRSSAREVVLVYDLGAAHDARGLEVRITRGGALVRRAEFAAPGSQVRHALKLVDGTYHVQWAVDRAGGASTGARDIEITEAQTIVLSVTP